MALEHGCPPVYVPRLRVGRVVQEDPGGAVVGLDEGAHQGADALGVGLRKKKQIPISKQEQERR